MASYDEILMKAANRAHAKELKRRVAEHIAEGRLQPKAMVSLKDEFEQLVKELQDSGQTRQQAVKSVYSKYPRLREALVSEANDRRERSRR